MSIPHHRPRLAVFVSGTGRTLRNIHAHIADGRLAVELAFVLASAECPAAAWARSAGLITLIEPGELSVDRFNALQRQHAIDFVALAGYLHLLPVPESLRNRIVNIHPALLPSFGGHGMYGLRVHRAVLEAGCKVSGCTVHLCDERYDTGPILAQVACAVHDDDTPESLAARVFALELAIYPAALQDLLSGRLRLRGRRAIIE